MKIFYAFFFVLFAFVGFSQEPLFHVDGTIKNRISGKPESGVKVEVIQGGASLFSVVSTSAGKYDLKGPVNYKVPFKIVYSKGSFVSKTLAFDYSKMNLEDAPPGEIRPVRDADFEMIPTDPTRDLSFLSSEPVGKFYWDEQMLEPNIDRTYNERIKNKIEKIILDAEKKSPVDDAKYQALVAAADALFTQQKWEEARTKYEEANGLKPTEKHPIDRINQCDAFILAQKKEELNNQNADSEYANLIAAADALRDQLKYEQAILKYEEALRKKDEDYPADQIYELGKLIEKDKKYKEAVTQADNFYMQRSWLAAKDKYTLANTLKPSEQHPITRLEDINKKLNEQSADLEKKKKYEDAVNAADELFAAEKYDEAKVKYTEAINFEPASTYPVGQIKLCNEKIAAALLEKQKKEKIAKLLEEGNTLFIASDWTNSKGKYTAVLVEDKENAIAIGRLAEIETKIKEQGDLAARDARFNKLVTEGDLAVKGIKYPDALAKYQEALDIKPDAIVQTKLDDVKKKIQDLEDAAAKEKRFQELKAEGMQMATEQKWLEAKSKLTEAQDIKADTQIAQKLKEIEIQIKANESLLKTEAEYASLMAEALGLENSAKIDAAIAKYKEASLKKPSETLPNERIKALEELKKNSALQAGIDANYNAAMQKGKALMGEQKYLDAIKEFNIANGLKQEEAEPIALAAECERLEKEKGDETNQLFEKMLSTAEGKLVEKDYAKARELADRAAKLRITDPRPKELLDRINQAELIDRNYEAKIVEAEKEVAGKNYQKAIGLFEQAKIIKPTETRPQQRIDELSELIANASSAAEKEALYADYMSKGALSEKAKGWDQALINYQNALNVKKGDKPAEDKINEIKQIIDDIANASKNEQERQDQFNKLIEEADGLFTAEDYIAAKSKYDAALLLISANTYAKGQSDECLRRERLRNLEADELAYRKVIDAADSDFNLKDYDKAKENYNLALTMRTTDPYPQERLDAINAIQNPKIIGSADLQPLGEPFPENSITGGFAALVAADIKRKNLKDEKIENAITIATNTESSLTDAKAIQQKNTANEIFQIVTLIGETNTDSDLNRQAIVGALREADYEYEKVAIENAEYKTAELNQAQDRIHMVEIESGIDYKSRDGVYFDNTNMLHSYSSSLRIENEERNYKDEDLNLDSDQRLKKIEINLYDISEAKSDNQKRNDLVIEGVTLRAEDLEKVKSDDKSESLLLNNAKIEVVNEGVALRGVEDAKHAPKNKEMLKGVQSVVIDEDQARSDVAGGRTGENLDKLNIVNIKISEDFTDRELPRKENAELVKENEIALTIGAMDNLEAENIKYLQNKNLIENEDLLNIGVSEKAETHVDANATNVNIVKANVLDLDKSKELSDDEQRMQMRSGVEKVNANAEEFNAGNTKKQEQNALIVEDMNKAMNAGLTNRETTKNDKLLDAQKQIESVDATKPEKATSKNALGQQFPEGVSQESFTQNDENGLMKAVITRRIVVINGEGNVYVRTQTLQSITYMKNNVPITEHTWNKETTGANLVKHY